MPFSVQLFRFIVVGVGNFALSATVFFALHHLLMGGRFAAAIAQTLSYAAGVALSYCLNRGWTFSHAETEKGRLGRFLLLQAGLLGATSLLVHVSVDVARWPAVAAWFVIMAVSTVANFWFQKVWVFRGCDGQGRCATLEVE
jgi:putative flippase GtrA